MIESALVDTWNQDEELSAWLAVLEDEVGLPFSTSILGVEIAVTGLGLGGPGCIVAVCKRGRYRQRVPLTDLPLPDPPPTGDNWIAAYRLWSSRV
ncbi:hypothetical protein GCM10027447_36250 [Glycomyces halotolerans]